MVKAEEKSSKKKKKTGYGLCERYLFCTRIRGEENDKIDKVVKIITVFSPF